MGAGLTSPVTGSKTKTSALKQKLEICIRKRKGENVDFTDMLGKIDKAGAS